MDDLLIAHPNFTISHMDTIKTLNFLYEKCCWLSPPKYQINLTQVKYLGFIIREEKESQPPEEIPHLRYPVPPNEKTA